MANNDIEKRLWDAADELRANSRLKASEYSVPVLGLIFLRYADYKFGLAEKELAGKSTGRRQIGPADYQARGVLYLPEGARFQRTSSQSSVVAAKGVPRVLWNSDVIPPRQLVHLLEKPHVPVHIRHPGALARAFGHFQ